MQVCKDQGVEFCEFPHVLSVSSCAYTVNKSTKEQAWTLDCHCPFCTAEERPTLPGLLQSAWTGFWGQSAQTNALRVCWG